MKKLKEVLKFIGVFILLISIYFILLTLISIFPSNLIRENIMESADYLIEKPESEKIELSYKNVYIFQFTNALMLNTAYSIDSTSPIESFLVARKNYIPGVTQIIHEKTPKDLQSAEKYYDETSSKTDAYQIKELYDTAYENDLYESFEYARYWHGYLVYLRPLLLLFNYQQIEILSTILFFALLIIVAVLICKKINPLIAISLIFSFLAVDIHIISVSINEVTCFILSLIFALYILLKDGNINKIGMLFFIIGSITNFIDFLTNPILTYALPILMYFLIIQKKRNITIKEIINIYFKTSILWALGYGLTWCSKWIITDLCLNKGIIENALEQVKFRSNEEKYTIKQLYECLMIFIDEKTIDVTFMLSTFFMFIQYVISHPIRKNKKTVKKSISIVKTKLYILTKIRDIFPYFIGIFIPIVWYAVLFNHSVVHRFFTYRNVSMLFFAFQTMFIILMQNKIEAKDDE